MSSILGPAQRAPSGAFPVLLCLLALLAWGCTAQTEPPSGGGDTMEPPASTGNDAGGSSSGQMPGNPGTGGGSDAAASDGAKAGNPGTAVDAGKDSASTPAGDASASDASAGVAGVVVGAGTGAVCTPLCVTVKTPTSPSAPDWSWENNASCVLPGTATGHNQTCTVGQPIPPKPSQPGVVILDNTTGMSTCVPLCVYVTTPNNPSAPDWSYENNASCVLPNTPTGKNQACTTAAPVPALAPRPGILLVTSGADTSCVPLCQNVTTPSSPTSPDWSYENNAACVLPNSPTAQNRRTCTAFGPAPSFVPPALTGTKTHEGFYTANGKLLDAYGHAFIMRGVSNPHIWFDVGAQYLAYDALDAIAGYGTNTVRVVWETTTPIGSPAMPVPAPASLLAEDLFRVVQLKMVPMVELHDATGLTDTASLINATNYYIRPDVRQVLANFQDYLLINIANEWSGTTNYVSAYTQAINLLRTSGINHTLVIDAPAFGQIVTSNATRTTDISTWFANAAALLQADPQHNLVFSVHMYGQYPGATPADVDQVLGFAGVGTTIPLIVGEFGWQQNGASVAYTEVMSQCQSKGLGYLGWSWFGNASSTQGGAGLMSLDMVTSWGGPLSSPWGTGIMTGTNGVQPTAVKATIFN